MRCSIVPTRVALDSERSFLHLTYSYRNGTVARLATHFYLATAGRDKVGFAIVGRKPDGEPIYAGKMRGMVERNTMRYFLAIEAYLDTLDEPESERLEKRLNTWFVAAEHFPLQLRELDRDAYLQMKREEVARQQTSIAADGSER